MKNDAEFYLERHNYGIGRDASKLIFRLLVSLNNKTIKARQSNLFQEMIFTFADGSELAFCPDNDKWFVAR